MTRIARQLQHIDTRLVRSDAGASSDFDLNADAAPPAGTLRAAAVLIPLIARNGELEVILTRRAAGMKHHPGQIAFPGGKVDAKDADARAAALREAQEEIGLEHKRVQILHELADHRTVTGFQITPFIGLVEEGFVPSAEPGEVAEVFNVPLNHVMNSDNFFIEGRNWMGKRRQYYVVPWGPYYIWGATARILRAMADRVGPLS